MPCAPRTSLFPARRAGQHAGESVHNKGRRTGVPRNSPSRGGLGTLVDATPETESVRRIAIRPNST